MKSSLFLRELSPVKIISKKLLIKLLGLWAGVLLAAVSAYSQTLYTANISKTQTPVISGHLKLGTHVDANGRSVDANSLYFVKDGKPWYPVMGEFHFSRYPRDKWEEAILRMKANGIDVIATYIFWIYHEEEEGIFNWSNNHDVRYFIALCKKHNINVITRIGPWCHGEVRNGGFPEWIVKRGNMRKNNAEYLASVQKLYNAIAEQLKGLYFKDGGPIVGTQIENEFRFNNPAGLEHMFTLKQMAIKAGIDVPFYTATGWPGSNLKQDELIPVWGAYPEAPWDKRTTQLPLSENYTFSTLRNDPAIGSDLLGKHEEDATAYAGYRYPYATAEMGGGIQITYHRRPIIEPVDVAALAYTKIGAGANLMGYYMFHGGHNEIGKLTTLQESKATNYPNDYPILNYDFQAPLGEFGQIRPSYYDFKTLHMFLNSFGEQLVQYYPSFADKKAEGAADSTTLRFAVRSKGESGFLFISNYQRQLRLKDHNGIQFKLKLSNDHHITFPEKPIDVKTGTLAILPFNMAIESCKLKYATVQPLCIIKGKTPTYVFFAPDGIRPEYVFSKAGIASLVTNQAKINSISDTYQVNELKPGTGSIITIKMKDGKQANIITLTNRQALNSWKGYAFGNEHLCISEQNVIFANGKVKMQSPGNNQFSISVFPVVSNYPALGFKKQNDGIFTRFSKTLPAKKVAVKVAEVSDLVMYESKGIKLPEDDRNSKNTAASPGPQYQTNFTPVERAKYWVLKVPPMAGNALLDIDFRGDTGAAYINGKLVADDFYFGKTMQMLINKSSNESNILLQVVPLTNERQIYFEKGIKELLQNDTAPVLKNVKVIPEYVVEL